MAAPGRHKPCSHAVLYMAESDRDHGLNEAKCELKVEPMRAMGFVAAAMIAFGMWSAPAAAAVNIQVDLSSQTMHVTDNSGESYDWPVSTARDGFVTPRGRYGVQSLQAMHYSRKYHNSPMPHSIFFKGGYAIHGTYETGSLGAAASHGCVRLSPEHAATLYGMVRAEGASISIVGSRPARGDLHVARNRSRERVADGGEPTAGRRHRRRDDAYALRKGYDEAPLAYAPARAAPSYGDWMENPFSALTEY